MTPVKLVLAGWETGVNQSSASKITWDSSGNHAGYRYLLQLVGEGCQLSIRDLACQLNERALTNYGREMCKLNIRALTGNGKHSHIGEGSRITSF